MAAHRDKPWCTVRLNASYVCGIYDKGAIERIWKTGRIQRKRRLSNFPSVLLLSVPGAHGLDGVNTHGHLRYILNSNAVTALLHTSDSSRPQSELTCSSRWGSIRGMAVVMFSSHKATFPHCTLQLRLFCALNTEMVVPATTHISGCQSVTCGLYLHCLLLLWVPRGSWTAHPALAFWLFPSAQMQ